MTALLLRAPAQIDASWLSTVLALDGSDPPAPYLDVTQIGAGLIGSTYRVQYVAGGATRSLIVKLGSNDPAGRRKAAGLNLYRREVGFYREFAPRCAMRTPKCGLAAIDETGEFFTLVLEDFPSARAGDQLTGCTLDEARRCVDELARLHAAWWGCEEVDRHDWVLRRDAQWASGVASRVAAGAARIGQMSNGALPDEERSLLHRFGERLIAYYALESAHRTLLHYDFRCDNLLFLPGGDIVVLDFQTLSRGPACTDLAYFIQTSLPVDLRRREERALVERYWNTLLALGVSGFSFDECWREYRRCTWAGLTMATLAAASATPSERSDKLLGMMAGRVLTAAVDLESAEFLGQP